MLLNGTVSAWKGKSATSHVPLRGPTKLEYYSWSHDNTVISLKVQISWCTAFKWTRIKHSWLDTRRKHIRWKKR